MRKSVLAGIFAYALFFVVPMKASAEAAPQEYLYTVSLNSIKPALIAVSEAQVAVATDQAVAAATEAATETAHVSVEHTVQKGDTLSTIATQYTTTWSRLFFKNIHISDPDSIHPGDIIVIPNVDEQLAEREIPLNAPQIVTSTITRKSTRRTASEVKQSTPVSRGESSGNLYTRGYCTWYVKSMRPDLPNNLGDAVNWVARARAQGLPTGSTPQTGAVGQRGNHVVYVESVNGDGTVTISEMNHVGWNKTSRRTLPANYFSYIYS